MSRSSFFIVAGVALGLAVGEAVDHLLWWVIIGTVAGLIVSFVADRYKQPH